MVSGTKMAEILDLLRKEAHLEEEERREKDATKVKGDMAKTDRAAPPAEEVMKDKLNK